MATRSHAATSLRSETVSLRSSYYPKETILRYSDTTEVVLSPDGETYSGTLIVENPTSRYALFKMKVSKATVFVVRPRVCIVLPHSSVSINITVYNLEGFKEGLKAGFGSDPKHPHRARSTYRFLCEEFVYHPNVIPEIDDVHNAESSELAHLCKKVEGDRSAPVDIAKQLLYIAVEDPDAQTEDARSSRTAQSYKKTTDSHANDSIASAERREQSKHGGRLQMSPASVTSPQEPAPNLAEMTQLRAKVDSLIGQVLKISADRDQLAVSLSHRTAELEKLYREKEEQKTLGLRKRKDSVSTGDNSSTGATKDEEKSSPRKYHLWVVVLFAIISFLIGRLSK